jgi:hypothetical protein
MKFRNLAVTLTSVLALTLSGAGIAAAHGTPENHPTPSGDAAARAEAGLLAACKGHGYKALYTPIDVPFMAPGTNLNETPQDDREATAFTFSTREMCRETVRAGLPVGLLARHPAGEDFVTTPAPPTFPRLPAGGSVIQPATLLVVPNSFQDANDGFRFIVQGTNFTPNADVVLLVYTRDNGVDFRQLAGKTDANGVFTYELRGTCDATQAVTSVSATQAATGKAAQAIAPAGLCV